ncbi:MAG TPA: SDR family oxidoreductase [Thermoleophilaceae bacterium]|nr:SDR family oxidoreductase [Thermoleophilaceae bacterium]
MASTEEQTILVTGATDGLGRAVAEKLARNGATVLVHGRDREKAERVVAGIQEVTGSHRLRVHVADLASLDQVRTLVAEVVEQSDRLDALVNNAGVGGVDRAESADGHELHFAVNHLAHFLLTNELLALLRRSAPARVVNVASAAQSPIDFDDAMLERGYQPMRAYAQSKLAQILFTLELAERLGGDGEPRVTVNALHPATLMDTNMVRENFGRASSSVEEGAEATVRLVTSPDLAGVTGRYFDGLEESAAHEQAYDEQARRRLWELSERLVGGTAPA